MLNDLFPALFDCHLIKIVFLTHASLLPLVTIFGLQWTSIAYSSYNSIYLMTLLLSILVESNPNIVLVSAAYNVVCMVMDILLLIVSGGTNISLVAILLIVFNLLCRPVSTILLVKNYSARAGVSDPTAGLLEVEVPRATQARSAYQNIDEPNQSLP